MDDGKIEVELRPKPEMGLDIGTQMVLRMIQLSELIDRCKDGEEKNRARSAYAMLDGALAELDFNA